MTNTYINEVELKKKKNIFNEKVFKNKERHLAWADDKKNMNPDKKLVNYDIENDLYFKKNVNDITSHLGAFRDLKSIIKKEEEKNKIIYNDKEIKVDSSFEDNKEEKEKEKKEDVKNEIKEEKKEPKKEEKKEEIPKEKKEEKIIES